LGRYILEQVNDPEILLTNADLEARYRSCRDPVERSHWHFLWMLARGTTATAVARVTGYSAYSSGVEEELAASLPETPVPQRMLLLVFAVSPGTGVDS
jgi:hypothetical protein